jgi:hypothetical protein
MNRFLLFIFIVCNLFSVASVANEVHIFLPGLQYRFENDSNQSVDYRRYTNYNLAAVIFDDYLLGIEFDEYSHRSESGSIQITNHFQEFNVYAGWYFYSKIMSKDYKIILDLGPTVYMGQNRTTVLTEFNSVTDHSIGETNLVLGIGVQATLRINYFVIQPEIRMAQSRDYQPGTVTLFGLRAGFRVGF